MEAKKTIFFGKRESDFNLKIYDVTTWETKNCGNILRNTRRSKGNKGVRLG